MPVNDADEFGQSGNKLIIGNFQEIFKTPSPRMNQGGLHDDQTSSPLSTRFKVVLDRVVNLAFLTGMLGAHGSHHDSISQLHPSYLERFPKSTFHFVISSSTKMPMYRQH